MKQTFILIAILFVTTLEAQFNLKVAYNAQYVPFKTTNSFFESYNSRPEVTSKYRKFNFMHGLDFGLRYMLSHKVGMELGLVNLFSRNNSSTTTIGTTAIKDEWRISQRNYYLGLDNYFGAFGFGVQVGYSDWKFSKDIIGSDSKQNVFRDKDYFTRFNLLIQVASDKNAFCLKPYYTLPFNKNREVGEINKILNSTNSSGTENFQNFGIAVIFYNGSQRQ